MKVGFISLGCSKNLVDTEIAIGILKNHNMEIVNNPEEAEMIIVNTCGFIDPAKEEAINTILEMAEYKNKKCKYLVAMGCLVQRYTEDLKKAIPEVDLWIRLDSYERFWNQIEDLINGKEQEITISKIETNAYTKDALPLPSKEEFFERTLTTGNNFAYLKIGEGCSNRCTYCAIPYIRGPFVSRPMEDIIEELVGNIFDEYDDEEPEVKKIDDNTYILSGSLTSYDLKKIFDVEMPDGDYETLSGYLIDKIGRIPDEGEHPIIEGEMLTYKVEEVEDKRIKYVKVCKNLNNETTDDEEE